MSNNNILELLNSIQTICKNRIVEDADIIDRGIYKKESNEQLNGNNDESTLEILNLKSELNALRASNEQLNGKSDESTLEILNLTSELSALRASNEELNGNNDESTLEILNLTSELSALRASNEELNGKNDESTLEILNLTSELSALRASNEELNGKNDESTLEILNLTSELNALRVALTNAHDGDTSSERAKDETMSLNIDIKELKAEISQHVVENQQMKQQHDLELEKLTLEYQTRTGDLDKLLLQCNAKTNSLTEEIHSLKQVHTREITDMLAKNNEMKLQLEELVGEKSVLKSVITSKSDELNAVSSENAILGKNLETNDMCSQKISKRLVELEETVENLTADRVALVRDNNERLGNYQALEKEYAKLQEQCDHQGESISRFQKEKESEILTRLVPLQAQVGLLQQELQDKEHRFIDILSSRDQEISTLEHQLRDRDDAIETLLLSVETSSSNTINSPNPNTNTNTNTIFSNNKTSTNAPYTTNSNSSSSSSWPPEMSPLAMSMSPVDNYHTNPTVSALKSPIDMINNNNIDIDRLFVIDTDDINTNNINNTTAINNINTNTTNNNTASPIVYLEIGSHTCKMGVFNNITMQFDLRYTCPSVIARVKCGFHAVDIVKGASFRASKMYEQFRETGKFVGHDGYYCCFEHPDVGLRGGLELCYPINGIGQKLQHLDDYTLLVQHCLSHLNLNTEDMKYMRNGSGSGFGSGDEVPIDLSNIQLIFGYKMLYDEESVAAMMNVLFESALATKVCLLSENSLAIACAADMLSNQGVELKSAILIDIGASCTRIYPIFDGMVLRNAIQILDIGGEHGTDFMEMLLDQYIHQIKNPQYSSQLPRRKRLIARELKHRCGLIVPDFEHAIEQYGSIEYQMGIEVMPAGNTSGGCTHTHSNSNIVNNESIPKGDIGVDVGHDIDGSNCNITKEISFQIPGGPHISVNVGCERFYCMEILFQPDLMYDTMKSKSTLEQKQKDGDGDGDGDEDNLNTIHTIHTDTYNMNNINNTDIHTHYNELNESNCNIDNLKHNNGLISKLVACLQCIDDKAVCEELLEHVLICGGSSVIPGLAERITEDLTTPLSDLDLSINSVQLHVLEHVKEEKEIDRDMYLNSNCLMTGAGIRMKHAVVSSIDYSVVSSTPKPLEITNIVLDSDVEHVGTNTISQLLTC